MSTRDFAISLAVQQIGYWRDAKRQGLPKSAAYARAAALRLLAQAKRFPK
ncbi:hypothetical protein [Falsirhodobacter xinxiangensis]|nr:hypothetical protein [Rhodobacter xinxiangensis]